MSAHDTLRSLDQLIGQNNYLIEKQRQLVERLVGRGEDSAAATEFLFSLMRRSLMLFELRERAASAPSPVPAVPLSESTAYDEGTKSD
jgi:hypothetical protein